MIESIKLENKKVTILDQTKLPLEKSPITCSDHHDIATAIRSMQIRGAPAIGIAAAMGVVLAAYKYYFLPHETYLEKISNAISQLSQTRPTAVNLYWSLQKMEAILWEYREQDNHIITAKLEETALCLQNKDIQTNKAIGLNGNSIIPEACNVLTYCNTGSLATAGWGTALGVIRQAFEMAKINMVYVCETRPLLQGARLTAWELIEYDIPATLITDNMSGYLMQQGKVDCIIVGADRIAANGDTANKIGTYSLALLAYSHNIPFYVAAPMSTFDFSLPQGELIPIEERDNKEVLCFNNKQIAPSNIKILNPAFDVTPAKFISGIITEAGIIIKPNTKNIRGFIGQVNTL